MFRHLMSCLAVSLTCGSALAADPAPLTGNVMLASDYKFRGFTQTRYKPALQGGFDFAHSSGFYVGNWNSNVEQSLFDGASLEMDVYGGFKKAMGAITYDVGVIHYAYPGSGLTITKIDNTEAYVGASVGPVSAKLYYALTDYFDTKTLAARNGLSTDGTTYLDVTATVDLGSGWSGTAHAGVLSMKNAASNGYASSVTDYKLGISRDISGWVLGAAYVTTSKKDYFLTGDLKPAGDPRLLVSLSKTF